jgi:pimeloyl-ACP methyl ester carboxylesterase
MPPSDFQNWFKLLTAMPSTSHFITVDGADIHYRRWVDPEKTIRNSKPGLLFLHGYGAHSHWWDFIAPAFLEDFEVFAMDMSGAGDSAHRDVYTAPLFAKEIISVCRDAGLQSPTVVGHSFGGSMTRVAAHLYGEELSAVVLIDSNLPRHRGKRTPPPAPRAHIRHYETLERGARRFRLRPPQPCENKYIIDYIARHSLAEDGQGYYFKLDQALFSKLREDANVVLPDAASMVERASCTVGFIYGARSRLFPPEAVKIVNEVIKPEVLQCIPEAHHHVFLDQPLEFIKSLGNVLKKL